MSQFSVLVVKELRESWRSFKFLWIPLVFILLGVSDPILNYFMEDILNSVGNLPEGFQMVMPEFKPEDLIVASTGQFQSIGLIVFISSFVGTISRERQHGTATLLYVRPISYTTFFLSKWVVSCLVAIVSVMAGYAGSLYYTTILFGAVEWNRFFGMLVTYLVWICLVMAVTVAMSAAFKTVIAATFSFLLIFIGVFIDGLIGNYWSVSPWKLANYGLALLTDSVEKSDFIATLSLSIVVIFIFVAFGIGMCKRKAATTKI